MMSLSAGLECMLDLRAAQPDANGKLATVPDLSGKNRTGYVPGTRPVLALDAAVGAQVGQFVGASGQYLRTPSFTVAQPSTHALVCKMAALPPAGFRYLLDGSAAGQRNILYVKQLPEGLEMAAPTNTPSGQLWSDTWVLVVAVYDGVRSALFVNDMEHPVAQGNAGTWIVSNGIAIFGPAVSSGSLAFYGLWSHNKSFVAREVLRDYVATEWGVAS